MKVKLGTVRDVAIRFGVHPETVRLWVRQEKIPCIRPTCRTIRFDMEAVEKSLNCPLRKKGKYYGKESKL